MSKWRISFASSSGQNVYKPQQMNTIGGEFYNRPTVVISNPTGPQTIYDGANLVPPAYAMNQMTHNDLQTYQSTPVMLDNNGTNFQQTNTHTTDTNSQQTVNNDTTTQMISTIIRQINGLENQIHNNESRRYKQYGVKDCRNEIVLGEFD